MAKKKIIHGYDPSRPPVFCSRVRERREALGMTQPQLGEKIGMVTQAVSRMESGKLPRDEWRLVAIAHALRTDLNFLFGLTEE